MLLFVVSNKTFALSILIFLEYFIRDIPICFLKQVDAYSGVIPRCSENFQYSYEDVEEACSL